MCDQATIGTEDQGRLTEHSVRDHFSLLLWEVAVWAPTLGPVCAGE